MWQRAQFLDLSYYHYVLDPHQISFDYLARFGRYEIIHFRVHLYGNCDDCLTFTIQFSFLLKSVYWNVLWSSNLHHSAAFETGFSMVSFLKNFGKFSKILGKICRGPRPSSFYRFFNRMSSPKRCKSITQHITRKTSRHEECNDTSFSFVATIREESYEHNKTSKTRQKVKIEKNFFFWRSEKSAPQKYSSEMTTRREIEWRLFELRSMFQWRVVSTWKLQSAIHLNGRANPRHKMTQNAKTKCDRGLNY